MPTIPYNPNRMPVRPQSAGRVDYSGDRAAIATEARATQQLVDTGQRIAGVLGDAYRDKVHRDSEADLIRFQDIATDAEISLEERMKAIPVQDGVSYTKEAQAAADDYLARINEWIEAEGNVRHDSAKRELRAKVSQMRNALKVRIAEGAAANDDALNVAAGKRGIERGIQIGDMDLVRRSVKQLHQSKVRGYETPDDVAMMMDRYQREADEIGDARIMDEADLALINGDRERFASLVDQLKTKTQTQKEAIRKETISKVKYNETKTRIQEARTKAEAMALRDEVGVFKEWDKSQGHESGLKQQANAKIDDITRGQSLNRARLLRDASRGNLDMDRFLELAGDDTRDGIGAEDVDAFRDTLIKASEEYEKAEVKKDLYDIAEKDEDYKAVRENMDRAKLGESFDFEAEVKRIRKLDVAEVVKADKIAEALEIQAAKLAKGEIEFDPKVRPNAFSLSLLAPVRNLYADAYQKRDFAPGEVDALEQTMLTISQLVKEVGYYEGVGADIKKAQDRIYRFFEKNRNADPEQIEAFIEELNRVPMDQIRRKRYFETE